MRRKTKLVVLLVSFFAPRLLNAQIPVTYKYCYCPKENGENGSLTNNILTGSVSRFDASNIALLEITVTKSDGSLFDNDQVVFTTGSRYPYGKKLSSDPTNTGKAVTAKYIKALFPSNETSVAVFINLVRQNQTVSLLGPITFYRSQTDGEIICDKICPSKTIITGDDGNTPGSDKGSQQEGPGIKSFFAKERVYPSDDAVALMKALNPGVNLDDPQKPLVYPEFPPVSNADQKAYEQTFRKQMVPNPKLNEMFVSNVSKYSELLDIVFTSKTGSDKAISQAAYDRFKSNLLQLGESLNSMNAIIENVSSIVSSALNEELVSLNNNLERIFQKRNITVSLYNEAMALFTDLDYMLRPYFPRKKSKKYDSQLIPEEQPGKQSRKQRNGPNPGFAYSSDFLAINCDEGGFDVDIQPNERLFYIYVFLDEANRLKTGKAATNFKVWYKPKAYENNRDKSHETQIGYASVTAKGLATSRLFFYLQRDNKLYKTPVAINIENELNRDDTNRKAYKLIIYLSDLKLTSE